MATLSILNLQDASVRPEYYADIINGDVAKPQMRSGKYADLKNAAIEYHITEDSNRAVSYLNNAFHNHYVKSVENERQLESFNSSLISYVNECTSKGFILQDKRKNIKYDLTSKLQLTGRIPVILKKGKLYYVVFYAKEDHLWSVELKYPFVQHYVSSELYKCDLSNVRVGIYSFESNKHYFKQYSSEEIDDAIKAIKLIGRKISSLI